MSSTDMHPFVHAFTPAIAPPWQARTDYDTFLTMADKFSELAAEHLGKRTDVLAVPLLHDTPDELAQPGGVVRDWKDGACEPVPGRTMPKLVVIERDYAAVAQKMRAVGPLLDTLGTTTKGITVHPDQEIDVLRRRNGTVREGIAAGRPSLDTASDMCEAILALSGTTNGRLATEGFRELERQTGSEGLVELASEREAERITFADTRSQPRSVMTSYEWSGSETGGRRYSPFVINTEHKVALPLHPEYRAMPMVWYVPPLSPVLDAVDAAGGNQDDPDHVFAAVTRLRIPLEYLAELFTAGDADVVAGVLMKLTALRSYMRERTLGEGGDESALKAVGLTAREAEDLRRLLAIAKYQDRYVVPAAHKEDAAARTALENRCPVETSGVPEPRKIMLGTPTLRRNTPAGGRP
ncbi:hypothetical protein ACIQXA_01910 [Streptomyces massasporeus]|uniref:hypothetical protein n=1 Tax=Streptomyces massasporeus TaxID=67324 RepID=UPI00382FD6FC